MASRNKMVAAVGAIVAIVAGAMVIYYSIFLSFNRWGMRDINFWGLVGGIVAMLVGGSLLKGMWEGWRTGKLFGRAKKAVDVGEGEEEALEALETKAGMFGALGAAGFVSKTPPHYTGGPNRSFYSKGAAGAPSVEVLLWESAETQEDRVLLTLDRAEVMLYMPWGRDVLGDKGKQVMEAVKAKAERYGYALDMDKLTISKRFLEPSGVTPLIQAAKEMRTFFAGTIAPHFKGI